MSRAYVGMRARVQQGLWLVGLLAALLALALPVQAKDPAQVDAVYAKAIELGGTDEGAPGERFPGFYAAYFRDLDGNKLNICHMTFDPSAHAPG